MFSTSFTPPGSAMATGVVRAMVETTTFTGGMPPRDGAEAQPATSTNPAVRRKVSNTIPDKMQRTLISSSSVPARALYRWGLSGHYTVQVRRGEMRRLLAIVLLVTWSAFDWGNQGNRVKAGFA